MARKQNDAAGMSLRTKDASDGGGIEGAIATMTNVGFVDDFNYGGTRSEKQAALHIEYRVPGMENTWDQDYSVGPTERYEVLNDGASIKALGKKQGLNKNCNAFRFFEALEAAAEKGNLDLDELVPIEDGAASVGPLEGRQVRLTKIPYKTVGGDDKELVVIDEFVDGDEAPAKGASKSSAKASGSNKVEAMAEAAIEALIADGPVKAKDLPTELLNANRKDPNVKAMMQLAMKQAWLESGDRPWEVSKGSVRVAQ